MNRGTLLCKVTLGGERGKVENNFLVGREFLLTRRDEIQFASRSSVTSESKKVHPEPNISTFIYEKIHYERLNLPTSLPNEIIAYQQH